jgi:hypothetical protein
MATERPSLKYSRLPKDDEDAVPRPSFRQRFPEPEESNLPDLRFTYDLRETVPWKSIFLALFLLVVGTLTLTMAYLIGTGHMGGDREQVVGFTILGTLLFLPGKSSRYLISWNEHGQRHVVVRGARISGDDDSLSNPCCAQSTDGSYGVSFEVCLCSRCSLFTVSN